ncbi:GntR family transcriptional regulator [Glycocaulis profundi]|nr:GntR family transcriptional regulator [Glycocaulis profundi]
MPPRLEVRTLSDRLVDLLRENIVSGEIPAGLPIRQDALARELSVSKIPLRESLARLEQDGLVISHPNRGFFVRPMSWSEAQEIFELRITVEPAAAAYASMKADEAQRQAAVEALERFDADAAAHKPTVGALNRAFHMALVSPGGRPVTEGIVERLHVMADRYVRKHLEPQGRHVRAEAEHHEILQAWLDRRQDEVKRMVAAHLEHTLGDLGELLEDGQDGASKAS